jgi:hypothetical protein
VIGLQRSPFAFLKEPVTGRPAHRHAGRPALKRATVKVRASDFTPLAGVLCETEDHCAQDIGFLEAVVIDEVEDGLNFAS